MGPSKLIDLVKVKYHIQLVKANLWLGDKWFQTTCQTFKEDLLTITWTLQTLWSLATRRFYSKTWVTARSCLCLLDKFKQWELFNQANHKTKLKYKPVDLTAERMPSPHDSTHLCKTMEETQPEFPSKTLIRLTLLQLTLLRQGMK